MTTFVTCYYKVPSKHSHSKYEEWIKNFLSFYHGNLVLFTTSDLLPLFNSIPTNASIHYIIKELNEIDIIKKYNHIWEEQEVFDKAHFPPHSRGTRTKECYKIWNSKLSFLKHAIEINPFNSQNFVWNDIGNVRNIQLYDIIKCMPIDDTISKNRIDITYIGRNLDELPINRFVAFQNQCIFSGSIFGSSSKTILQIYELYYQMFDYYLNNNLFIGCDQQIWASLYCKYPHLFNVIDTNKYILPQTVDKWFALHYVYSQPQLKICLVGPGNTQIPPIGWGACETIVWDYYENLKNKNIDVEFISDANLQHVVTYINSKKFDFVHIMYDDYVSISKYIQHAKILYTSHYAYITHPQFHTKYAYYFKNIFLQAIHNQPYIHKILAISDKIKDIYIQYGISPDKIEVLHNGAREDKFEFHLFPEKLERSIYLAKIETRKGQYKYQSIPSIDFVGNYQDSDFNRSSKQYLGEWTKQTLYSNLSHYGNLVLLSDGEADPLVVKEALLCGLGVVLSECCSSNLDLSKDYITVVPQDKLTDITFVNQAIETNRKISNQKRHEIRKYGLQVFSWNTIINKYINIICSQ